MMVLYNDIPKIHFIETLYILRTRLKFGDSYLKVVTAHTFRSFKTTCPICYLSSVSKLLCCLWFTKLATRVTIDPFFVYVFIAWGNYRLNLKYCVIIRKKIQHWKHSTHSTQNCWLHILKPFAFSDLIKKRKDANIFRLLCIHFCLFSHNYKCPLKIKKFCEKDFVDICPQGFYLISKVLYINTNSII